MLTQTSLITHTKVKQEHIMYVLVSIINIFFISATSENLYFTRFGKYIEISPKHFTSNRIINSFN